MTALDVLFGEVSPWSLPMDHLSPASISEFYACPEKWRRKRLHREREPSGPALLIGNAVHAMAEHAFKMKLENGNLPSYDDCLEAAGAGWDASVKEAKDSDGIEWQSEKPGDVKDQAVALAGAYRQHPLIEEVEPVAIEERHEVGVPSSPVPIVMRTDVRQANSLMDVKTVSKSTSLTFARPDDKIKALVYISSLGLPFEWHYVKKTPTPNIYKPAPLAASSVVLAVAHRRIGLATSEMQRLYEQYGPDETWPTNAPEHQWRCSYCGLRRTCAVTL